MRGVLDAYQAKMVMSTEKICGTNCPKTEAGEWLKRVVVRGDMPGATAKKLATLGAVSFEKMVYGEEALGAIKFLWNIKRQDDENPAEEGPWYPNAGVFIGEAGYVADAIAELVGPFYKRINSTSTDDQVS
jgi:hypothetical protein